MSEQTTDLVMLALGCRGSQPQLEDGVHLRWQVSEQVGYPPYGFDILRRPHRPGSGERTVAMAGPVAGRLPLRGVFRALTIRCSAGAGGWVAARFAGSEMLLRQVSGSGNVIQFFADAIDELEAGGGAPVDDVRGILVQDETDVGWTSPLNGPVKIGFPLTDAAYPCRHAQAPNDWAEARARLQRTGWTTVALTALETRFGGPRFQDLRDVLQAVVAGGPSPILSVPAGQTSPSISLAPSDILALAATDPDLARILGLLWIDRTAPPGMRFDYRVIGYWSPGATTTTRRCTQVPPTTGTTVTSGFVIQVPVTTGSVSDTTHRLPDHRPSIDASRLTPLRLTMRSGPAGVIVASDSPWGFAHAVKWPRLTDMPIRLDVDQPTSKVVLYLSLDSSSVPDIRIIDSTGQATHAVVEVSKSGGPFVVVTVGGGVIYGIEINTGTEVSLFGACVDVIVTTGQTLQWTCFDVTCGPSPVLEPPVGLSLATIPLVETGSAPLVRPSVRRGALNMGVGLRWGLQRSSTAMPRHGAISYHVFRRSLGNGATPAALPSPLDLTTFTMLTEDVSQPGFTIPMPVRPISSPGATTTVPSGWPQNRQFFVDGPLTDRWYAYAVTGVDLFGRTSPPTASTAELRDRLAPPPPVGVTARFIDPAIPADDPAYDSDATALTSNMTDGAIAVRWSWPHYREWQAPDVREFRIYWQPGRWNVYPGRIDAVQAQDEWSEVSLTLDDGPLSQWMGAGWLRVGSDAYQVNYTASLRPLRINVRNRLLRRTAAGGGEPPPLGRCSLIVGGGGNGAAPDPNFRDPRDIVQWARRIAVVPYVAPPEGQIAGVSVNALSETIDASRWRQNTDGTLSLRFERPYRGDTALLIGATVTIGTTTFRVVGAAGGRTLTLGLSPQNPATAPVPLPTGNATVNAAGLVAVTIDVVTGMPAAAALPTMAGGTLVTAAGEILPVVSVWADGSTRLVCCVQSGSAMLTASQACAWYPDYEVMIPNPGLVLSAGLAQVFGSVAMTTADLRDEVANRRNDDPQRLGNEGEPTAPLIVRRARRTAPAAPAMSSTLPSGQTRLETTDPDFYGRVRFTVNWPAVVNATGYLVYRALAQAVARVDQGNRRLRQAYYQSNGPFDDDPGFMGWLGRLSTPGIVLDITDFTANPSTFSQTKKDAVEEAWMAWSERFYSALTDAQWQALASRAGNEIAFGRATPAPVEGTSYADEFEAPGPDRFFYRMASLDSAGNQSALGVSTLPVYVPDRIQPTPPVLTRVTGGDRRIELTWLSSQDEGVTEYLIYRSDTALGAADIRDMTLVQRVAIPAGPASSRPPEVLWRDGPNPPVPAASPRWYRLCVRRTNGMVSRASEAMAGVAFDATPAPVILVQLLEWRSTGPRAYTLRIVWASQPDAEVRVQRRVQGRSDWKAVTSWLQVNTASFDDTTAEYWLNQEVRLEARLGTAGAVGPIMSIRAAIL